MTDESPRIDDRTRNDLVAGLQKRGSNYTEDWDPYSPDSGQTLLFLFSRFEADVLNRLNDVPHKHRVSFLNSLGFDRRPPQSARVPLTFTTTANLDTNVVVPGGTQTTAETDDGETVIFEIPQDDGFEATAATLRNVYSLTPEENSIFDHSTVLESGTEERIFTGSNQQKHIFYIGHEAILNLEEGARVTLMLETTARDTIDDRVQWEYFGEDEQGESGWQPLPVDRGEAIADPFDEGIDLEQKRQLVKDRVRRLEAATVEKAKEGYWEETFRLPGPTAPTEISGIESRWIRGRIPGDEPTDFEIEIEAARMNIEGGSEDEMEELRPEMVFSNDIPIAVEEDEFYPFGRRPHPPKTLYIASEEAFTKDGGEIDIVFDSPGSASDDEPDAVFARGECPWCDEYEGDHPERHARQAHPDEWEEHDSTESDDSDESGFSHARAGPLAGPPEISWEYWNGSGWTPLGLDSNDTDAFRSPGTVSFTVPDDFEDTTVSGHNDYWVRARLVSGNYGQPQYEITEDGTGGRLVDRTDPPIYGDIRLQYGHRDVPFEHAVTDNNASYDIVHSPEHERLNGEHERPVRPFTRLPDDSQTLYLGFDAPLRDGPINLHVPMLDKAYPREFDTGLRWEFCERPEEWAWKKLNVSDGTEGLTERGIVSINFPTETTAFALFGERRHWIRARITRDSFVTAVTGGHAGDEQARNQIDPDHLIAQDSRTPPTLEGIHPNTQWAYNERTVEEVLGSSDGAPEQEFFCRNVPITEAELWINEAQSLSEPDKRELEADRPDGVRREETPTHELDEYWVRWQEVSDFLASGEDDRHYTLNRTKGVVGFGDGREGAIAPIGDENVTIVYQTGGGSVGNVRKGAISSLRTSVSHIDSVRNLKPSDGGTDTESVERAITRAPTRLKNRGRAVSASDFEQIAKDASRQLATVKCEPGMTDTGERTPGWITLLVIPRERRHRPTPSLELRQRVKDAVSERAPATLAEHDRKRIVVRGPDYAEVSVSTTVQTRGVESITNLKNTIEQRLEEYFHPLTGGRTGDGWEFGRAPQVSQIATLIESVAGVDRVRDIAMIIETATEEKIIRDPNRIPLMARDEMVSSGTHDVTILMKEEN